MHNAKESLSHLEPLEIRERGAPREGEPQYSERRLFFQLHVFENCDDAATLMDILEQLSLNVVLYADLNHPSGVGVLFIGEDPAVILHESRNFLTFLEVTVNKFTYRSEMTMMGRTYSSGREQHLEEWLLKKPLENVLHPDNVWAIWYPLRRRPAFYRLERRERARILGEHAMLGRAYAADGYARDIRLACFGLDTNDNEFVIGLVGPALYPLSRLIQEMRHTQQTAEYIESLGPFFVGHVLKQFRKTSTVV